MIITRGNKYMDIDIYFPEYDWVFYHARYEHFKSGNVKCPYEPIIYNVGYYGEGKYKATNKNNKSTKCYNTWRKMLERCYNDKTQEKHPTYKGCSVCEEWYNFQNFAKWYEENYYEIEGQRMCLDKDILVKGNKIYSPSTCIFVPNNINVLFTKSDKVRGEYPIGVRYREEIDKFNVKCNNGYKKSIYLGSFNTPHKAFLMYKLNKELVIQSVAEEYKDKIPNKLYEALMNYKVEEND